MVLKWLCGRSGASGRVSRCRHGVGCVVSLSLVWCCGLLCGSSGGLLWLWWSLVWLCVSGGLCGSSGVLCVVLSLGAVSGGVVLSGVGLFSGGLVCCLLVSGGVFSGLVFWCLVWCLVYYQQHLKFLCTRKECHITHDTLPLAYHTINFILGLLHH